MNQKLLSDEDTAISKIKINSKAFYALAKNRGKNNNEIGPLMSEDGTVTSDQYKMANILLNPYHKMFSTPVDVVPDISSFPRSEHRYMENYDITNDEVDRVLKKLKGTASPGPDGILGLCYKHGDKFTHEASTDCFNQSIADQYASVRTTEAWISPTWKREKKQDPANYRPIALTNIISKIMKGVIRDRVIKHMIDV